MMSSKVYMLSEEEKARILYEFNNTDAAYPDRTIHELFEEQAAKTPTNVAVVCNDRQLTYEGLNQKANQLAGLLRNKGVKPDSIVGIMVERSIDAIVGMLAVLKAGGAYLPIDPNYPEERIQYILKDSGTKTLLTTAECIKRGRYAAKQLLDISDSHVYTGSGENLKLVSNANHLAYVIYTSGSTGKPKGVMIEHRGVVNLQVFFKDKLGISSTDRVLQFNNISFDASVGEIFKALLTGSTLYIAPKDIITDYEKFIDYINRHRINIIALSPTYLEYLNHERVHGLKIVVTGGSKISHNLVERWAAKAQYVNEYGPTETTIIAASWKHGDDSRKHPSIPIGKPIANTNIYIMDKNNRLQPIGVPGEICISGKGVARGYLNRPALTAEKFIDNPYVPGEKMYKSGDLGEWLPDGNIAFLGRIDDQVKIRGFRIELGEIENHLLGYETIKEAVVVDKEGLGEDKYLCAYMVADRKITVEMLREYLAKKLPDYMFPSYFMQLDKMPLTPNGKIDRKALQAPEADRIAETAYEAPGNEIEEKLAEIWRRVLGVERVGINDSFSELGGHSLKAIDLVSKMNTALNIEIPLKELFRLSTIRNLCKFIESSSENSITVTYPLKATDYENMHRAFPLTGVQLAYLIGRDEAFEMGGVATNGYTEFEADIDMDRFNMALQKMISRHPILHTIISEDGTQRILKKERTYQVNAIDLSALNQEQIAARILEQRRAMAYKILDPGTCPLFEIKAFMLPDNRKYFFLIIDPLICDDSSMKILIKEIKMLYKDPNLELPELAFNFRDYVLASVEFKHSQVYKRDERYWMSKLEDFPSAPVLPLKCAPAELQRPHFGKYEKFFEPSKWQQLKYKAKKKNLTTSSLLCAAYAYVLAYWSNQNRFAINLTVFNRLPFHKDVKNIIGDFTTLMLLDVNIGDGGASFWKFALKVQDALLEALHHRHYDGVDFIRNIAKKYKLDKKAVMPIVFTSVLSETEGDSFDHLIDFDKIKYFSTRTSQVYIDNQVYEINGGLYITWDYVEQLFDSDVIETMFKQYLDILDQVLNADRIDSLMLSPKDSQAIAHYNDTDWDIQAVTLHELFSNKVKQLVDKVAVKHHRNSITYRELDEKSNQVARYLTDHGVRQGDFIGVIGKRCIETIVNLLGILKAGAAYIPLDPDYPEERKQYIKEKSGCKFFITPAVYMEQGIARYSQAPVNIETAPDDMAYVIFTSGSTGKPKGVQITHDAVTNTILDINEKFRVTEEDRIMGISSLCFDLSVYDIFGTLSSGATLVLIDDQRDVFNLKEVVEEERITIWNSVPAIMDMVMDLWRKRENTWSKTLRLVMLSGDWIPLLLPEKIRKIYRNAEIISLGGATEASIWSIYYPIKAVKKGWKSIPYGNPLANQKFYVLNNRGQLCPTGVEGELYIGGVGVAKGYINDTERTNEAFITHPKLGYLYKTGDHGVLREEGYIEFMGRKDSQVKIRGYRVELGEIENCLAEHEQVKKAVVIDYIDDSKTKNLYAYVIPNHDMDSRELKAFLSRTLPGYMIPARFIKVENIPLTVNGKVNKSALLEIAKNQKAEAVEAVKCRPPENNMQKLLIEIWKEILGINSISIDDNYYEIGGDSLKAIAIISEIDKRMNIKVPVREIFRNCTINTLSGYLQRRQENKKEDTIKRVDERDYYPTSPAQKRMYALSKMDSNSIAYHIPMALLVEGELKIAKLEKALKTIIIRHEALRTGFEVIDNELVQKIYNDVDFTLAYRTLDLMIQDKSMLRHLTSELCTAFVRPFNLAAPPLMRAEVIRVGNNKHIFILDLHHIIADGMSQGILMNELLEVYDGQELPEVKIQYKDYVEWLKAFSESEKIKQQEQYWQNKFKQKAPVMNLPTDYKRRSVQSFGGGNVYFSIGRELTEKVRNAAKKAGTTLYMLMLSVYNVLLYKYTGQDDIIVGTTAAGRSHRDLQNVFGVFINTMALRNKIDGEKAFKELLLEVKETTVAAFENSDYPFNELVSKVGYERDIGRNPLFDTMFVLEDTGMFSLEKNSLKFSPIIFELDAAKFDITFTVLDSAAAIAFNIEYCTDLFKRETMERLKMHFIHVLEEITRKPDKKIDDISILPEEEKNKLLKTFNATYLEYPQNKTVLDLFREQTKRNPQQIAAVYGDEELTYRELDSRATAIAGILKKKGVQKEDIVAVMTVKSTDIISGILGILKSGACYMPIDPEYPKDRIHYMLEDSKAKLLVTQQALASEFDLTGEVLFLDDAIFNSVGEEEIGETPVEPRNAAYVIYTSGTTGRPKGVVVEHKGLMNLCMWHNSYYRVTEKDRASKYAGPGFDASVWEIFPYLVAGASIYIISDAMRLNINQLNAYLEEKGITIGFLPTQMFEQFIKLENRSLTRLLTGADKLKYVQKKNYELYNNYGPTEYTVVSTCFKIDKAYENIPIGRPISNTNIYILDKNNRIQPIGIPGELCVSGHSISRGYLNHEELTGEKFIENPYEPGTRMYKTGDRARWLPDGNIEFWGRMDNQVKVRGFRVEPGEIESLLVKIEGIGQAVVVTKEEKLYAYVVSNCETNANELREILKQKLPAYMIPFGIKRIDSLPVNQNGKIAYHALPAPDEFDSVGQETYVPAGSVTESLLADIWGEVLGIEKISMTESFYHIGGDSLKAAVILYRINKELNVDISIKDIFEKGTIREIAAYIDESAEKAEFCRIEKVSSRDYFRLSPAQDRIYSVVSANKDTTGYNIPLVMLMQGEIDLERVKNTLNDIIQRHDILRTAFYPQEETIVQKVCSVDSFHLEYIDLEYKKININTDDFNVEMFLEGFVKPFDLSRAPLMRGRMVKISAVCCLLLLDIHHIISDGISLGILMQEFVALYKGEKLEPLLIQYGDYAEWQSKRKQSDAIAAQEAYWLEQFKGTIPQLNLVTDYPRPGVKSFEGDHVDFVIGENILVPLKRLAEKTGTTLYMILLCAFKVLLYRHSHQEDIVVGTVASGRSHVDLQHMMGMFVNTLAIRSYPAGHKTFKQFLNEVRETSLGTFKNGDYPFQDLVNKLLLQRDMSRNPLFDVMFVYDHMDQADFEADHCKFTIVPKSSRYSKFDLTLTVLETEKQLNASIEYCKKLFKKQSMTRMVDEFIAILESVITTVDQSIDDIRLLSPAMEDKIINEFNRSDAVYPSHQTAPEVFKALAVRFPEKKAIVCSDISLSYEELDKKSDCLAVLLRQKGITNHCVVGLMVERSVDMAVGILAILKSGGAYLPILPEYPRERVAYMLNDSGAKALITQQHSLDHVECDITINIEDKRIYQVDTGMPDVRIKPSDLAYVIYTSGTSGKPKGVMIEHRNLMNLVYALNDIIYKRYSGDIHIGLVASFVFDGSVKQIFASLLLGYTLYIASEAEKTDGNKLLDFFIRNRIAVCDCTPAHIRAMMGSGRKVINNYHIKQFCVGGEALPTNLANAFIGMFGPVKPLITNLYGPTETTVDAAWFDFTEEVDSTVVPIGKPIHNVKVMILDRKNRPVPLGVPGELYISGAGIGRGYINNEALTRERFLENPYFEGEKMYKTGDLTRWLPDGNIEFLGRMDRQVKIRGFRIELEEIEHELIKHASVRQAVVLDKEDATSNKILCAYMVLENEMIIDDIRRFLEESLPQYMIPAQFCIIDKVPITTSGKVDRVKLLNIACIESNRVYEAATTEMQKLLLNIWEEVLNEKEIGISDNFYNLGGDSIKAIQIASKLHKAGYKLEISDILKWPYIKEITGHIKPLKVEAEQGEISGNVRFTPVQRNFFMHRFARKSHFNQSVMLFNSQGIDAAHTKQAMDKIIAHHDALRMKYEVSSKSIKQTIMPSAEAVYEFSTYNLREDHNCMKKIEILCNYKQKRISVEDGPLAGVCIFKTTDGDYLLITISHLVVDGVSWRIILEDFISLYNALQKGEAVYLHAKSHSYKVWAERLAEYAASRKLLQEKTFWKQIGDERTGVLPRKTVIKNRNTQSLRTVIGDLSREHTQKLLKNTNKAFNTEINDILIAALCLTMKNFLQGHKKLLINMEGHGRENIFGDIDISTTVGWFTCMYPVVLDIVSSNIKEQIISTKETLRHIPNKGIGYGILRFLTAKALKEDINLEINPEISFNYLGDLENSLPSKDFQLYYDLAGKESGDLVREPFALNINAYIKENAFRISFSYSTFEFEEKNIVNMVQRYIHHLKEMIDFCANSDNAYLTPSDYDKADGLSFVDLQEIEEKIKRYQKG